MTLFRTIKNHLQTLTGVPAGEGCRTASSPHENYCSRVLDTPANLNLQQHAHILCLLDLQLNEHLLVSNAPQSNAFSMFPDGFTLRGESVKAAG